MFGINDSIYSPFWHNGPKPGAFYDFPASSSVTSAPNAGYQRTSQPITTGSSVIGLKYDTGVIIAADTLVSYGKLLRYRDIDRVFKVNDHTIIGVGGEYADFQFIKKYIDQKVTEDYCYDDKNGIEAKVIVQLVDPSIIQQALSFRTSVDRYRHWWNARWCTIFGSR